MELSGLLFNKEKAATPYSSLYHEKLLGDKILKLRGILTRVLMFIDTFKDHQCSLEYI